MISGLFVLYILFYYRLMYNMVVMAFRDQNGDEHADLSRFCDLWHQQINDGTWPFIANVPYNILDEALKEAIQVCELVIQRNVEARAAGQDACCSRGDWYVRVTARSSLCV